MHSKKYRTMRRNARRYQSKHMRSDAIHFASPAKKINVTILVTSLSAIALIVIMHCCLNVFAKESNYIVNTKTTTTNVYVSTDAFVDLIKITDDLPEPIVPIEPIESLDQPLTEISEYKIEQDILAVPEENEVQIIEKDEVDVQPITDIDSQIGNSTITIGDSTLIKHDLPSKYYPDLDFSSFQPYMGYKMITNKSAPAYGIVHSDLCYTDEYGLRRYKTNNSQFTIDDKDDYVIALGTFYKEKGLVGNRYLIVTSTGMYTAITGDEKSDAHTDSQYHMFTMHDGNTKAGIIEWIVDQQKLNPTIKRAGTVTVGGPEVLSGEILYIYEIK